MGKRFAAVVVAMRLTIEDGRWMMVVVAVGKFFTDWSQPTTWGAITAGPILGRIIDQAGWTILFWTIVAVYVASRLCWLAIETSKSLVIVQDKKVGS
jgi:hypothetical protein